MFHHVIESDSPTPGLQELVEKQREFGGRLIMYRRAWTLIFITVMQNRIVWVPPGGSRYLAGWKHGLFTLLLGIWSPFSLFSVPILLLNIFRGGVDVTEFYSTSPIDPLRNSVPVAGTAEKESKQGQYDVLFMLLLALILIWFFLIRPLDLF